MAYIVFTIIWLMFPLICLYLSYFYGQWKKQPIICTVSYTVGWLISLLFIGVLPLDIASAFAYINEFENITNSTASSNGIFVDKHTLTTFWRFAYWASQILTWIILPIMESFAGSGEFTFLRKLKSAAIDNAIIYGSYLVLFICVMIYLLVKKTVSLDGASLRVLLITTSNTWGLFLVILFLGYGLVEVPRSIMRSASPVNRLHFAYFSLSKRYLEYIEDEEALQSVLAEVHELDKQVGPESPLRSRLNVIVSKVTDIEAIRGSGSSHRAHAADGEGGPTGAALTPRKLVKLHKRLKRAYHHASRAHALWLDALRVAAAAEDVLSNCKPGSARVFERGTTPAAIAAAEASTPDASGWLWQRSAAGESALMRRLEWAWRCRLEPLVLRAAAVILAASSFLVVWSECTFFVRSPRLSVVAAIIHAPTVATARYNLIAFVSFVFLGYLGFCVCFTAYRLRFFNYYRLVPNHHSDAISLIFYGYMLCRLTPSLCLNFLCLAHLDSHVLLSAPLVPPVDASLTSNASAVLSASPPSTPAAAAGATEVVYETAFTRFMGHLDVVGFIAGGFNVYFPMVVVALCLMSLFSLGSRLLICLGMPQLIGPSFVNKKLPAGESSAVDDAIEDGRMLLHRERTLGRSRRFNREGASDNLEAATRRDTFQKRSTFPPTDQISDDMREVPLGETFGSEEPVVEFSEDKMNAMFGFGRFGLDGGGSNAAGPFPPRGSRNDYTPLSDHAGEGRPLYSRVISSIDRFLHQR